MLNSCAQPDFAQWCTWPTAVCGKPADSNHATADRLGAWWVQSKKGQTAAALNVAGGHPVWSISRRSQCESLPLARLTATMDCQHAAPSTGLQLTDRQVTAEVQSCQAYNPQGITDCAGTLLTHLASQHSMSIHLQLYCCTFYKDDISARASYLVSCAEAHDPACERGSGRLHLRSGLPARDQPQLPASAHHTRGHPPVPGLRPPVPLQLVRTAPTSELISYSPDPTRLPESNRLGNWILAVCWVPRQLDSSSLLGASDELRGQACAQTPVHADGALSSPCCWTTAQDTSRLDTTHSCPPDLAGCLIMQPYDATLTHQGLQSPAS